MTHLAIAAPDNAQAEFEEKYITASEIMKDLKISRATLAYARATSRLPNPIVLNEGTLYLWERALIQPYLDAWKVSLTFRRGA